MEHTNHKFPAATATGVPCEVKSTVHMIGSRETQMVRSMQAYRGVGGGGPMIFTACNSIYNAPDGCSSIMQF